MPRPDSQLLPPPPRCKPASSLNRGSGSLGRCSRRAGARDACCCLSRPLVSPTLRFPLQSSRDKWTEHAPFAAPAPCLFARAAGSGCPGRRAGLEAGAWRCAGRAPLAHRPPGQVVPLRPQASRKTPPAAGRAALSTSASSKPPSTPSSLPGPTVLPGEPGHAAQALERRCQPQGLLWRAARVGPWNPAVDDLFLRDGVACSPHRGRCALALRCRVGLAHPHPLPPPPRPPGKGTALRGRLGHSWELGGIPWPAKPLRR